MVAMTEITCKCGCGRKKEVRTADVNRGWGLYFDKSCKATHQEARTGQYHEIQKRRYYENEFGGTAQFNRNGVYEGFTLSMEDMGEGNVQ